MLFSQTGIFMNHKETCKFTHLFVIYVWVHHLLLQCTWHVYNYRGQGPLLKSWGPRPPCLKRQQNGNKIWRLFGKKRYIILTSWCNISLIWCNKGRYTTYLENTKNYRYYTNMQRYMSLLGFESSSHANIWYVKTYNTLQLHVGRIRD